MLLEQSRLLEINKKLQKQGMVEVKILEHLRDNDPEVKKHIVRIIEYFHFRNHL